MLDVIFWWLGCVLCVALGTAMTVVTSYSVLELLIKHLKFAHEIRTWLYYRRAWREANPTGKFILPADQYADLRRKNEIVKYRSATVVDLCDNIIGILDEEGYHAAAKQLRQAILEHREAVATQDREVAP